MLVFMWSVEFLLGKEYFFAGWSFMCVLFLFDFTSWFAVRRYGYVVEELESGKAS